MTKAKISKKIKRLIKDNPDLSYKFIKNIFIAKQEVICNKLSIYKFD